MGYRVIFNFLTVSIPMQKHWTINKKYSKKFAREFPEFSEITLQLLWDRDLKTQTQIDEFFNPDYEADLYNPHLMKGMDKAVERIYEAFEKEEKILVYGDYDVDGITSSLVMVSTLVEIKSSLSGIKKDKARKFIGIYIPDRESEGYGMNDEAVKKIKNDGFGLIITVDCGTSNFASIKSANDLGIDVIVTDHHHIPEKIPNALAIINPNQSDCGYPFKELAGVGVAFKLAQALIKNLQTNEGDTSTCHLQNPIPPGFEKWLLDLVALGTVADCVNLTGENRTLVKYGLLVINKTKRVGIKKLISKTGLKVRENGGVIEKKAIDTNTISFTLAPRLNAAGRMDHANTSYQLLYSDSESEAEKLVLMLEKNNQNRQQLTEKMITEIRKRIDNYGDDLPKVVIESGEEWKIGIVGLVAGKLADEYSRPFLILSEKDSKIAGSGRSIPKFNLIEAIEKCKDILIEFGGHSQAAGLKVESKNLEKFRKKINLLADKILKEEDLVPLINIDCKIEHNQIDWQLNSEIEKFNPFGFGNRKPVFLAEKLEIHEIRTVGANDAHLKLCFKAIIKESEKVKYFSAIGFRLGKMAKEMPNKKPGLRWGDIVDVVFQLEINEWNGNRELQMNVLDLKFSVNK